MSDKSSNSDHEVISDAETPTVPDEVLPNNNTGFYFKVSKSFDRISDAGVLPLKAGDVVVLISSKAGDSNESGCWWYGEKVAVDGSVKKGKFPASNVQQIVSSNPDVSQFEVDFSCLKFDKERDFLGKGGFGEVFLGKLDERDVAIKIPNPRYIEADEKDSILRKIKKEAFIQHHLIHQNIVKLLKISINDPHDKCLVMEYCAGGPLHKVIHQRAVAPRILFEWALQIARGMKYLHYDAPIPIIHKDLKSNNILFYEPLFPGDCFENKTLKITDFGLAKPIECEQTHVTAQGGTVEWMAPEVIKKSAYSPESDTWSFGVVFWELLIGQPPYKGVPYHAVLYKIGENNVTLPIPRTLYQGFATLLENCWKVAPKDRLNFIEIIDNLEKCLKLLHDWPPLSAEDFQKQRQEWYATEINYDYLSHTGNDISEISEQLIMELVRAHQEMRKYQLQLAEKELSEALEQQRIASEKSSAKSKSGRKKKHPRVPPDKNQISFPQDFKHEIGIVDNGNRFGSRGNSLDNLDTYSMMSTTSNFSYTIGGANSEVYKTWSHGKRPPRPWLSGSQNQSFVDASIYHTPVRNANPNGSLGHQVNGELSRSRSCKSESNITSALVNQPSNSKSPGARHSPSKKSLTRKLADAFSKSFSRKKEKVGTPLQGPTQTFTRDVCDQTSPRGPPRISGLPSTPGTLIRIEDSSSRNSRPTQLDLSLSTYSPRSARTRTGSTNQATFMSTYSDEFEGNPPSHPLSPMSPSMAANHPGNSQLFRHYNYSNSQYTGASSSTSYPRLPLSGCSGVGGGSGCNLPGNQPANSEAALANSYPGHLPASAATPSNHYQYPSVPNQGVPEGSGNYF